MPYNGHCNPFHFFCNVLRSIVDRYLRYKDCIEDVKRATLITLISLLLLSVLIGCRYAVAGSARLIFQPVRSSTPTSQAIATEPWETESEVKAATAWVPVTTTADTTSATQPTTTSMTTTQQEKSTTTPSTSRKTTAATTQAAKTSKTPSSTKCKTSGSTTSTTSTTTAETTTSTTNTSVKAVRHYLSDYEQQVIELVNKERAKEQLPPLKPNAALAEAARVRAKEIASVWGHDRPNGASFSSTIKTSYCLACENIAAGQRTPEAVVKGWMNSPGHRKNIMNPKLTHIGVGCYYDSESKYKYYWGQIFIAP